MNPQRKIDADKIHILDIKILEGNIECGSEADVKKIDGHSFEFKLNTGLNDAGRFVGLKLIVNIVAVDKKQNFLSIKGSYTHEMIFSVENLDDFVEKGKKGDMIDAALGSTLVSIIYSTVRGIIYSRTQGTSLGVVTLPVVAPLKLMGLEDKLGGQIDEREIIKVTNSSGKKEKRHQVKSKGKKQK